MSENKNNIDDLKKEAIDASLEFEEIMDSIDFNSYLPEDQELEDVKRTTGYRTYRSMVARGLKSCKKIIEKVPKKIRDSTFIPNSKDKNELEYYIIYQLFEAKEKRLGGRQQIKRQEEKKRYIDSTHKLHNAFDYIPKEEFYDPQKNCSISQNYNWAKVLFYNEMAICYSGLAESSMSLGYAERSRLLLEELHPQLKNIENSDLREKKELKELKEKIEKKEKPITFSQLLKLYTFALYNKGEADRLLHNNDLSLRTFKRIIEIYTDKNLVEEPSSDYYSSLLRMALILIDQGRGKEALELLGKVENLEKYDYRKNEC